MHKVLTVFSLMVFPSSGFAAESSFTLSPIQVTDRPSFETLREESLVPVVSVPLEQSRSSLLDDIKWNTLFPLQNFGFPSGANGISLGGRSIDDTQVTTLGVPLNQAIGGGADLSGFPSFLWSEVRLAPSTTSAGFVQQSASGNLDLVPWSWAILKPALEPETPSRVTLGWDRDLQTVSVGTRKSDISILAGTTMGRQSGPAGSLSYRFLKKPGLTLYANFIGTDQQGEDPGSIQFPTPGGIKKTRRVIPSLMSHYSDSEKFGIQTTLFGDFQVLEVSNNSFSTSDRTKTLGVENAVLFGNTTVSISARNVNFTNNNAGTYSEWPARIVVIQGFESSSGNQIRISGTADYLSGYGIHPGGRISSEFPIELKRQFFLEAQITPKLPSIQDRLYVLPSFGYQGNPDVLPERVHAIVGGFSDRSSSLQTRSQIRLEYRTNTILFKDDLPISTVENSGNAQFISLSENLSLKLNPRLNLSGQFLASFSRLSKNGNPYPRLPYLSAGGSAIILPRDWLSMETQVKWMGRSTESNGSDLPAYALLGEKISITANDDLKIILGLDNLLDSRVEMIRGYPLPGRMAYASLEMGF